MNKEVLECFEELASMILVNEKIPKTYGKSDISSECFLLMVTKYAVHCDEDSYLDFIINHPNQHEFYTEMLHKFIVTNLMLGKANKQFNSVMRGVFQDALESYYGEKVIDLFNETIANLREEYLGSLRED